MSDERNSDGTFAKGNDYRFRNGHSQRSLFSWEIVDDVLERVSEGESLTMACANAGISRPAWYSWMRDEEVGTRIRDMYAIASAERADLMADEIISIADQADPEKDNPQLVRLRVDARKWYAAKLNPKRYSDRVLNEHSGPDGGPIESKNKHTPDLSGLTDDQLEQLEGLVTTAAEVITKRGSDPDGEEEEMGEESA